MDGFWQLLDGVKKSALYYFLQKFSWADWGILFAVLWGMAVGIKKGASEMFAKVLGLFLSGVIVLTFYHDVAASLLGAVPALPEGVANPIAFLLLTGFTWISMIGCVNLVGKFFRVETQGSLKMFGGMIFGAVYFLLLISLVAQFLLFIPSGGVQRTFSGGDSFMGGRVAGIFPVAQKVVVAPFLKGHDKAARPGKH